ncbi:MULTISPECIES: hypothetical protein [unclassified Flavobacterium]|jgi:hypothetical protein|uniref:hypothetical protein n=1 Tax=unclassified Flavobacterium TaxID=196869 RepID=UPI000649A154|nr:hypothetical protein [Flavobacterium sp. ABG]KLT70351.1 hypothetical protein AB674_06660 [Flavobacterium sp. ABG]
MSQTFYKGSDGNFYPVGNQRNTANNFQRNNSFVAAPNQTPQQGQIFKRSGAVYSKIRNGNFEGNTIVNAWRKTKMGLMQATVTPYSGGNGKGLEIVNSQGKSGNQDKEYQKMICTIKNTSIGTNQTYHVLMNVKTQVIVIQDLGLCITPNGSGVTRSGKRVTGYFGKNFKSR